MEINDINLNIRKTKDNLYVNGYGVIVFIFWSIIKFVMYLITLPSTYNFKDLDQQTTILLFGLMGLSIIELGLYMIVGILAVRVGKNDRMHKYSLSILSIILLVISFSTIAVDIYSTIHDAISGSESLAVLILAVVMDFVFLGCCFMITISSFRLNKLLKLKTEGKNNER